MSFLGNFCDFRVRKRVWVTFVIAVVGLLLGSCDDSPEFERERALIEKAEEKTSRVQEEMLAARQKTTLCIGIAVAGIVTALVIGAAIGSKARKDAKQKGKEASFIDNKRESR